MLRDLLFVVLRLPRAGIAKRHQDLGIHCTSLYQLFDQDYLKLALSLFVLFSIDCKSHL